MLGTSAFSTRMEFSVTTAWQWSIPRERKVTLRSSFRKLCANSSIVVTGDLAHRELIDEVTECNRDVTLTPGRPP
jgi:hypothetical protein